MSVVQNVPISKMMETIMYVKMCREGHDFSLDIEAEQAEKKRLIEEKIDSVRANLLLKQQQAACKAQELLDEVVEIDIFEPAQSKSKNIEQEHVPLEVVEINLMDKVKLLESELGQSQAMTILLQTQLEAFIKGLKKGENQHYGFQAPMNAFAKTAIKQTYGS